MSDKNYTKNLNFYLKNIFISILYIIIISVIKLLTIESEKLENQIKV